MVYKHTHIEKVDFSSLFFVFTYYLSSLFFNIFLYVYLVISVVCISLIQIKNFLYLKNLLISRVSGRYTKNFLMLFYVFLIFFP